MKRIIRKSLYLGVLVSLFSAVISCEEDFTNIGTEVISNTKFDIGQELIDIKVENSPLEKVQSDNISREPGEYLLGVYASPEYEKVEASIISQVAISVGIKLIDEENSNYGADTTVVTTIDTVFIKLPYHATLEETTSTGPEFKLDSIIGDQTKSFTLNVYQTDTYLNSLDPTDPSKLNKYYSNSVFQKTGSELNSELNLQFKPNKNDTLIVIKRRLSNDVEYTKDTVKYVASTTNSTPLPFARIPLKEDVIKALFLDKYDSNEFASQDAFNDYFRGLILEATGNEGSLISFSFGNTSNTSLNPSIEVYYTNTVLKSGTIVIDTISKNHSFPLLGLRSNNFKMEDKVYPVNNEIILQGTAGSEAKIDLFGPDNDGNGIADKIEELRTKNLLVNDASLTFYINQSADTTAAPYALYLYKYDDTGINPTASQIKDVYSEGTDAFNGRLVRDGNGKKEKYTFKITDYISDLLSGETNYSPTLKLKVLNVSDYPVSDSIFTNYSWNPKAVTLFNNSAVNGDKKAQLKISYSEKKD
ncbi:DUF4270 domain-containing protein [Polaribacter sp. MSW13]|uniref:DUF4270 domain-containing protein n=1 Tax=Polaribacter marinus TaxID=2916838 RepID=A0A9X2AMZ3_9FLAO|nr:DUF4270 domain-containing protein [Polaribacter marinus]